MNTSRDETTSEDAIAATDERCRLSKSGYHQWVRVYQGEMLDVYKCENGCGTERVEEVDLL